MVIGTDRSLGNRKIVEKPIESAFFQFPNQGISSGASTNLFHEKIQCEIYDLPPYFGLNRDAFRSKAPTCVYFFDFYIQSWSDFFDELALKLAWWGVPATLGDTESRVLRVSSSKKVNL